jgi:dUTP pyrophosphatase
MILRATGRRTGIVQARGTNPAVSLADNQQNPESTEIIDVPVRIGPAGQRPLYATAGSAGCDLFAAEPLTLLPGETRLLPLDLVMALPMGVEAQIRPRSGLSLKTTLRLPNSPGTIDSDFRDGVAVLLHNTFSQADLPARILNRPSVLAELSEKYSRMNLADYLQRRATKQADKATHNLLEDRFPELAGQVLYVDEFGNPYGTIYIQPGERVAQMVFCRYLRAHFAEHPEPEDIGADRGGGFGSTGL